MSVVGGVSRPQSRHLSGQLSAPVRRLVRSGLAGATLLVAATLLALIWANSPWGGSYERLWHTEFAVRLGDRTIGQDLQHWVNDGLMVFFFFLLGMEVRRELSMGELAQRSRLTVPAVAAVGGLVLPALIYYAFNAGTPAAHAWGIPIATDTAFVLGALAVFGRHFPIQLRVFLLSLSVVDDIGALSVIAIFYTDDIDLGALAVAGLCVLVFIALSKLQVWRGPAYFAVGVVMWFAMYQSGVHATIGGVVLGLLVSAYPPRRDAVELAGSLTRAFRQSPDVDLARQAKLSVERAMSPNERIGAVLVPWTTYLVVPVFALANAGVRIDGDLLDRALGSPVTHGVFLGLVVGKLLGVALGAMLAVKLRLGSLPPGVTLGSVWAGAALTGLGFTVSLFVTDLAFDDEGLRDEATVGILAAAVASTLLGALAFRLLTRRTTSAAAPRPVRLDPPVDPAVDHVRGPEDAPLTLVEFGDVECPFCGRATGVIGELRGRFGDELRYVFRHLPLVDVHPHAELAAEATEAAGAQGAFWAMHDRLFSHQGELDVPDLLNHAAALGLDLERFTRELGRETHAARVRDDVASAEASGVGGTPTFFVNGIRHDGPTTTDALAAALLRTDPRGAPGERLPEPAEARGDVPMAVPVSPQARLDPVAELAGLDGAAETPDTDGSSPRLSDSQLAVLHRFGRRRPTATGDVLVKGGNAEWDFVVVLTGTVAVVEDADGPDDEPRVISVVGPKRFLGGLNMLAGQRAVRSIVAAAPGEVLTLSVDRLRAALAADRELSNAVMRAMLIRRAMLIGRATGIRVLGDRRWPASERLRQLLADHGVGHTWLDPTDDPAARTMIEELEAPADTPVVLAADGRVLFDPSGDDLVRLGSAPVG
ncbi:Na+/H+ antiporter NhaA [Blastococcus aurantiacus]|uniref:Na(+)/H(+) antiporter NhaA n=1 Tax=Blastococcus aurantiacus TaxID=1550231 RepID=A0A1G7QG57_9ACTN|nr:Na+/H+ antiporter NhaA [Blastococcus aurantiacus]SDF97472.1 Na+/H+ antiporter NhaA [Blastococcus aurantiacus]